MVCVRRVVQALGSAFDSIIVEEYQMDNTFQDRRRFLFAVAAGVALVGIVAGRLRSGPAGDEAPQASIAEAKALLDAGATIIDVRSQGQFAERHLPNAALVPLDVLQAAIPAWLLEAKTRPVIVYCNRGAGSGPAAARLLQASGFSQVVNLASGIEGWAAAGMPLQHG